MVRDGRRHARADLSLLGSWGWFAKMLIVDEKMAGKPSAAAACGFHMVEGGREDQWGEGGERKGNSVRACPRRKEKKG